MLTPSMKHLVKQLNSGKHIMPCKCRIVNIIKFAKLAFNVYKTRRAI